MGCICNIYAISVQYLCQSDESYTNPPSTSMMTVTTAVNPTSVHHLCKICATHELIFEWYTYIKYWVQISAKKYTWKYLCYTCANICARKMMARVAVKPLPVQIRRESSYLPHTDPQCPPSRWLRGGHLCHSFTCNLSRGKGKPHSGAKLFWDLLCDINFRLPFLGGDQFVKMQSAPPPPPLPPKPPAPPPPPPLHKIIINMSFVGLPALSMICALSKITHDIKNLAHLIQPSYKANLKHNKQRREIIFN